MPPWKKYTGLIAFQLLVTFSSRKYGINSVYIHCCRTIAARTAPTHESTRQWRQSHEETDKGTIQPQGDQWSVTWAIVINVVKPMGVAYIGVGFPNVSLSCPLTLLCGAKYSFSNSSGVMLMLAAERNRLRASRRSESESTLVRLPFSSAMVERFDMSDLERRGMCERDQTSFLLSNQKMNKSSILLFNAIIRFPPACQPLIHNLVVLLCPGPNKSHTEPYFMLLGPNSDCQLLEAPVVGSCHLPAARYQHG